MTRYFLSFLCLFACLTVVTGCGNSTEPTVNVSGPQTAEEIQEAEDYEAMLKKENTTD